MKAVIMKKSGDPKDFLALEDINDPAASDPESAIVRMRKRVIHPADFQTIRGYLPAEVFAPGGILGIDGTGVVEAVGNGVEAAGSIAVGTRVIVYHAHATWAERVAVNAAMLMPVPDDIDDAVASQLGTNGVTAVMLLRAAEEAIRNVPGTPLLLVSAAGSSVARTLVALAAAKGHKVIGLVRRGADAAELIKQFDGVPVIGTDRQDWQDAVRATGGSAAVAIDPIGGAMMPTLLGLLAPGGTLITYGQLDPEMSPVSSGFVTSFELTIRGCSAMGWAMRTPPEGRAADFASLFELARHSPHLFGGYQEFGLEDVVAAIAAAEASPRRGATILTS